MAKKRTTKKLTQMMQTLPVKLTDVELLEKGQQLAQLETQASEEEKHAKAVKKELDMRAANIEMRRSVLAEQIRNKSEPRDVLVEAFAYLEEGVYEEIRSDTGEVVAGSRRRLSEGERQDSLALHPDDAPEAA